MSLPLSRSKVQKERGPQAERSGPGREGCCFGYDTDTGPGLLPPLFSSARTSAHVLFCVSKSSIEVEKTNRSISEDGQSLHQRGDDDGCNAPAAQCGVPGAVADQGNERGSVSQRKVRPLLLSLGPRRSTRSGWRVCRARESELR